MSVSASRAPECRKLRAESTYSGKQGFDYFEGIARETVGSSGICMHLLTIPPGGRARAHKHDSHETAIYVLAGSAIMYWGEKLEHCMETAAGDMIYIPANKGLQIFNRESLMEVDVFYSPAVPTERLTETSGGC